MAIKCNNCGTMLPDTVNFCTECGTKLDKVEETKSTCSNCGSELREGANFCVECGSVQTQENNIDGEVSDSYIAANVKVKKKNWINILLIVVITLVVSVFCYNKFIENEAYEEDVAMSEETVNNTKEYSRYTEREEAEQEKALGSIKTRLNDICKDISANKDTRKYLSVRLKGYVDNALKIEEEKELYGEYLDADMWTNTQDNETVTAEILDYTIGDEENISVKVLFKDSYFGDLVTKILDFRFENNNWFVNDMFSANYSNSFFVYTNNFINSNDGK